MKIIRDGFMNKSLLPTTNQPQSGRSAQFITLIILSFVFIYSVFRVSIYSIPKDFSLSGRIIWTFWEPRESKPSYIRLCMRTWKVYLPHYTIVEVDYSNIRTYLGSRLTSQILGTDLSLAVQADAVRVALLNKYGGIWLDADTIITGSSFLAAFGDTDLGMFGKPLLHQQNIGFIYSTGKSKILKLWLKGVLQQIKMYKRFSSLKRTFVLQSKSLPQLQISYPWNFLGNGVLDNLVVNTTKRDYRCLDRDEYGVFPELILETSKPQAFAKYVSFYFSKGDPQSVLNLSHGLIMLHNSWTPANYKRMSEKEFLQQDIMLAKLLSAVLDAPAQI